MIWLDFFLQCFVHALAWCTAAVATAAVLIGAAYAAFAVYVRMPLGRDRL